MVAIITATSLTSSFTPALAESGTAERTKKEAEIPICSRSLGTIAVRLDPQGKDWWTGENLASPDTVIKSFVKQSHCFTLVDRGAGMALADEERARATSGNLRAGSNIGRGQVKAADYILVPSLMSKNSNAGGSAIAALAGAFVPGIGGALLSGINLKSKTADVLLSLVDVRSGEEVGTQEGHAKKKDLSWGAGAGGFGTTGLGAVGAAGYTDTELGQIIMLAYLDAYTKLVAERGGVITNLPAATGSSASAASVPAAGSSVQAGSSPSQPSFSMIKPGHLYENPSPTSKVVRALKIHDTLYATGQPAVGIWISVTDDEGRAGWVSSHQVITEK
jgi:curli biogenesis system outer membrane secretion channel CsgG